METVVPLHGDVIATYAYGPAQFQAKPILTKAPEAEREAAARRTKTAARRPFPSPSTPLRRAVRRRGADDAGGTGRASETARAYATPKRHVRCSPVHYVLHFVPSRASVSLIVCVCVLARVSGRRARTATSGVRVAVPVPVCRSRVFSSLAVPATPVAGRPAKRFPQQLTELGQSQSRRSLTTPSRGGERGATPATPRCAGEPRTPDGGASASRAERTLGVGGPTNGMAVRDHVTHFVMLLASARLT